MLVQDVIPQTLQIMSRQQCIIVIAGNYPATIRIPQILAMYKNLLVIDNRDRIIPNLTRYDDGTSEFVLGNISRIEPDGNVFATAESLSRTQIANILYIGGDPYSVVPDVYYVVKMADMFLRMVASKGCVQNVSSFSMFPQAIRQQIIQKEPEQVARWNTDPIHNDLFIQHSGFLDQVENMHKEKVDQFKRPSTVPPVTAFDPNLRQGQILDKMLNVKQPQPQEPLIYNQQAQPFVSQEPPVQQYVSPDHIEGMLNAIIASGNDQNLPPDVSGAFVNSDGQVMFDYKDGSISPPVGMIPKIFRNKPVEKDDSII